MSDARSFSERNSLRPKKIVQLDSIDLDLRNGLYNAIYMYYLLPNQSGHYCNGPLFDLLKDVWVRLYKLTLDEMPDYWPNLSEFIKNKITKGTYNEVYDLLEFIPKNFADDDANQDFREYCNQVMQEEMAAYRFVGKLITRLTSSDEIKQIETALDSPIDQVKTHISQAHESLANKKNPDYRNSIKESISAVEPICKLITGTNATLGQTLGILSKKGIELPASLQGAFEKLYGWSSSEDGIRHGLLEKSTLDHEDALFVLTVCSAFANYLIIKAVKADIHLEGQYK